MTPRQQHVTSYLASLAQAVHNLVPPDAIEPLVVKIANEFVSEAAASEVAAAGLNSIREICARQPLAMTDTLLQDLVQYKKSKDKGVMMAAKGLLSLYREVGAELLQKKDRGKDATIGLKSGVQKQKMFGEEEIGEIEGLELLEKWKEEQKQKKLAEIAEKGLDANDEDEDGYHSEEWEVASDDSDDSGDWIKVSDDDEPPPLKKQKGTEAEQEEEQTEESRATSEGYLASKLATTTILTPADLVKLQELRRQAAVEGHMSGRSNKQQKEISARHLDDGLTAEQIELPAKLRKTTKEERMEMAKEGRSEREEHKSTTALRKEKKEAEGKSTTNKEKARKKHFMMTLGKGKDKQKRSLRQVGQALKGHVARAKRGGRRGNNG